MTLKEAIAYLNQMKKDAYGYTECEKDVEAIAIAIKSLEKEYVRIGTLFSFVQLVLSENLSEAMAEHIMDELESHIAKDNENNVHTDN